MFEDEFKIKEYRDEMHDKSSSHDCQKIYHQVQRGLVLQHPLLHFHVNKDHGDGHQ